ncbi:Thij/pfpi family protein [Globisporangium polare]
MHVLTALLAIIVSLLSVATPSALASDLHVGVIVYDNATTLDFIGPLQYFDFLQYFGTKVRMTTIAQSDGLLRSAPNGVPFHVTQSYTNLNDTKFDMILISGGTSTGAVVRDAGYMAFIKAKALEADYVLSVCTGAYILAATGMLDGKNATTNKRAFDLIAPKFPQVNWQRRARWVVDGNLWTSSGIAAGIDLGRAFVAHLYNETVAARITQVLEIIPNTDPSNDPFAV